MEYNKSVEIIFSKLKEIVEAMENTVLLVVEFPEAEGVTKDE